MELQKINLGTNPNDKTGDSARVAGQKINTNTDIIAAEIFKNSVLKSGGIAISGLNLSIAANAFAWRINQQEFLTPATYSTTLVAAADGFYRADIIVGTSTGAYQIIQGTPSATAAVEPNAPANTIRLSGVVLFGDNAVSDVLDLKANIESPAFTGTPTAPTATAGTNTTQVATTAFVVKAKSKIYCWGDSMTFGVGSTVLNDFPALLIPSTNWEAINNGVPGETSTQIKNRFVSYYTSNPEELKKPVIIWAGRNNYPNGTTIKADIATMIAMLPHKNYLVLGITNSNPGEPIGNSGYAQIVTLNNELKTLYGGRFLDVRAWLVSNYNPLLPQDVADFNLDLPPTSLLSDNIHLNDKGYRLVLDLIVKNSSYLKNEESIVFDKLNAYNLYLPNTYNSILKTNVNGLVTNSAIFENDFNLGLGLNPVSTADSQNFEFINGSSIMSRVAVPQFALSTNAYGTFYASKYKTSNFSAQILLNGNGGDITFYTAPSGIANSNISYQNRLWITNSGRIVAGGGADNGVDQVQVNGSVGIETFMYLKPSTTPATPREGTVYYDSTSKKLRCWNGTTWNDLF